SNLVSLVKANGFIVLPEACGDLEAGKKVLVQIMTAPLF
ncbi:MAG: hypothetical protein HY201_06045, partial [Nitrospirae bacterium]|nr:hypothetical protein [Candidatus Troglogloeales bacterium]